MRLLEIPPYTFIIKIRAVFSISHTEHLPEEPTGQDIQKLAIKKGFSFILVVSSDFIVKHNAYKENVLEPIS